jgi:NAD(P)-dependent dehydrogenase (short-subunit alcohol dehydrogenase family)
MNEAGPLSNRVCLITGAGRGIGRSAAEVLARGGARVVIADISESGAQVAEAITDAGGQATYIQADVSNDSGARACVEQTIAAYGQLDSLINNAGILRLADSFEDTTDSQLSDMMRVNFESVFRLSRAALPALEASGRGSIVNTASMVGYRIGMPGHAVYGASKGAVVGLSMTMAIELAPRRVRVNCVAPGVVATDLYVEEFLKDHSQEELEAGSDSTLAAIPIGTYAAPEQVGEVIAFLAGDASSYVTGQTVLIDGGFTGI